MNDFGLFEEFFSLSKLFEPLKIKEIFEVLKESTFMNKKEFTQKFKVKIDEEIKFCDAKTLDEIPKK